MSRSGNCCTPAPPTRTTCLRRPARVQVFLTDQVQEVYRSQGVSIHDKHIEIIVRQMLRRITVLESGDADLLPGELRGAFAVRGREPPGGRRGWSARVGPAAVDGHHEGVAGD